MNVREQALRWLVMPMRLRTALSYYWRHLASIIQWLFASREHTNFTCHLTGLNRRYLARFLGEVCGETPDVMAGYLRGVLEDKKLREHIARPHSTDYESASMKLWQRSFRHGLSS